MEPRHESTVLAQPGVGLATLHKWPARTEPDCLAWHILEYEEWKRRSHVSTVVLPTTSAVNDPSGPLRADVS